MMKLCPKCQTEKPLEDFNLRFQGKYSRQSYCRDCQREVEHTYYRRSEERRQNVRDRVERNRIACQKFVAEYLKSHPCVDCGESNSVVLEFDHINEKSFNLSDAIRQGYSLVTIQKEIEKCEVRCANCHRMKTAKEQSYWILEYL